jgi:hypothetical protein
VGEAVLVGDALAPAIAVAVQVEVVDRVAVGVRVGVGRGGVTPPVLVAVGVAADWLACQRW